MCGIAGYFGIAQIGKQEVLRATSAQYHRGPDDGGLEEIAPGVVFGQRRLSILDLSPLGHQPMQDPVSGSWIVFNGEIYNFQNLRRELESDGVTFRGHSDTEVLLAGLVKHGRSFLSRLEGMYGFAFWNARQNSLLVARDPMGIKPFYFFLNENEFGFASETKALLSMGRIEKKIDEEGLVGFLRFGAIQHPSTLWQGIKSLGPGEWMTLNRNSVGNLVVERMEMVVYSI